jgi:endoglucanase
MAAVKPEGSASLLVAGLFDEIGVFVTHIEDEGFAYITGIGGWDPQVLVAQRIRFMGRDGDVLGVIGRKPIHLLKNEDREKACKFNELWVDIGATSKAEAEARLSVGDAGVVDARTLDLPNGRIASRSIDNRIGAFTVLEALRRYAERPGAARVVGVATTQEEIAWHGGGALISAANLGAEMAIVVDVTFSSDHPGLEKKELGEHTLGGGPVLTRGSVVSPVVFNLLRATAEQEKIPFTINAAGRATGTDADAIHLAGQGVATALVSIPNRYMHSPNEMVSLDDVDRAAALIAECCRRVDVETDFTAR